MKKKLIVLIIAIAGIVGAQAQDATEKAFIQSFISDMDKELAVGEDGGMHYNGTSLEGRNIICSFTLDESQFGGMTMKEAFEIADVTEESFGQMMREEIFSMEIDEDDRIGLNMLKKYGYKIYFRLIGSDSKQTMNCLIDYEAIL